MSWKAAFELLKALPQIIALIRTILALLKKEHKEAEERKREAALEKVQKAEGGKETEDAFKDLFNNR